MGDLYTCIGKGGRYEVIGVSVGAGTSRTEVRMVYRDVATGKVFHRKLEDFGKRMQRLAGEGEGDGA